MVLRRKASNGNALQLKPVCGATVLPKKTSIVGAKDVNAEKDIQVHTR